MTKLIIILLAYVFFSACGKSDDYIDEIGIPNTGDWSIMTFENIADIPLNKLLEFATSKREPYNTYKWMVSDYYGNKTGCHATV